MKYCQVYIRYNIEFKPMIEEKICIWFEWEGEITGDNEEKFDEAMDEAYEKQRPPSWKLPFGMSQRDNMALGKKHSPELSWSTVMTEGTPIKFDTPIFVKNNTCKSDST